MDAELKALIEENLRLSKETNKMLRSMRTEARIGLVAKVIIWIVLILVPLYFLLPFFETYMDVLESSAQDNPNLQKLLEEYQNLY